MACAAWRGCWLADTMPDPLSAPATIGGRTRGRRLTAPGPARTAFRALECVSFAHSCIYGALLVCAFAAGKPEPATFALGLAHGLLWIGMSLACLAAARLAVVPLRLAVAVAVLGGLGPFFGSYEFVREQRRERRRRGS